MNIKLKFKNLIAVVLLSGFSSLVVVNVVANAAANTKGTDSLAPEATVAESELSFRDIPYLDKAFINSAPADRKDALVVGKLSVDGGNKGMIEKLAQEIADGKHGKFDSLLIAHKGKLLFESYYNRGRINLPHPQASATKTYTSMAIGRAIQLGYLTMADLDKPLVSFLKDLDPTKFVEGAEKITLYHAMTMRSGIRISQEQREAIDKKPDALKGQGQVQAYLDHSAPITEKSQTFKYQNDPIFVMQVLDALVPGTAMDFIKNEVLGKMGITNFRWQIDLSGLPHAGSRASITSRDMVKFGMLAANNGKWNNEQLIPEEFIIRAINKIVYMKNEDIFFTTDKVINPGYGYYWWQADMKVGDKLYSTTSAQGGSGQMIILVEELDLIVVTTVHRLETNVLQITAERILPVFIENMIATMSKKSGNQNKSLILEGPYIGQKPPSLTPERFAPGIVSTEDWQISGVFTPDLKEFYFIREVGETEKDKKMEFVVIQNINNRWQESVISPRVGQPFIAPDGKTLHLGRRYMERTEAGGWSEIKSLGASFEEIQIMRLTASSQGTFVFDEMKPDGVLRYSRLIDGKREEPKPFSKEINTGKSNAHPFIAPDESYILWDGRRDSGQGNADIYISFREEDDSWGEAINLGDQVNTVTSEFGAHVTPDGKYLFFNRDMGKIKASDKYEDVDIFWVDAKIIEKLRPK